MLSTTMRSFLCFMMLAVITGAAAGQTDRSGTIRGTVVRAMLGTPIRGATVTIVRVADENGAGNDVIAANNPGGIVQNGRGARGARGAAAGGVRGAGDTETRTAQTDSNGSYTFGNLAAGLYRVRASASGFVSQGHGQQYLDMLGTPVLLTSRGVLSIDFQLVASGAIEGLITDPDGLPMADSRIQVFAAAYDTGQLMLVPYSAAQANSAGEYRVPYLDPGEYYVAASPPAAQSILARETAAPQRATIGRGAGPRSGAARSGVTVAEAEDVMKAYAPTFYPSSVTFRDAAVISIASGLDAQAVNITLKPVTLLSVRGTVLGGPLLPAAASGRASAAPPRGPGGRAGPMRGAGPRGPAALPAAANAGTPTVELIPAGIRVPRTNAAAGRGGGPASSATASGGTEIVRAPASADGSFRFDNVIPGSYIVFASAQADGIQRTASGRVDVFLSNVENYTLALREGQAVPGQVYLNGAAPQGFRADSVEVTLTSADSLPVASVSGRPGEDGKFQLENVAPGRYRMTIRTHGSAFVERALFDGADALNEIIHVNGGDVPIQALIGFTRGDVVAFVEHGGKPFPNARVLLAPANRTRLDLFKLASSDQHGRAVFSDVPPGTYKVFAWASMSRATAWRNPAFLDLFEDGGRAVTVERTGPASEVRTPALPHAN